MTVTTKSSYGVRALIDLAIMYRKKRPLSIGEISHEEGISNIYLEQIFNRLKNHGLVKSIRGPKGGYLLSEDPSGISVYDAVKALDGDIYSVGCVLEKRISRSCARTTGCASKEVWDEVAKQIRETLSRFSLEDLADRALEIKPDKLKGV